MAGQCISPTQAALVTLPVMGTTAIMGQAVGAPAGVAVRDNVPLADLCAGKPIRAIQQQLLADGCFLPNVSNADDDDARSAAVVAPSEAKLSGAGPTTPGHHAGLSVWKDQPQCAVERWSNRTGQMFAVGHEGVSRVARFLRNGDTEPQRVAAKLYAVNDIWDYHSASGSRLTRRPQPEHALAKAVGHRTTDGRAVEQASSALIGLPGVSMDRGDGKKPGAACSFTIDRPADGRIAVHQRGTPTLPAGWKRRR